MIAVTLALAASLTAPHAQLLDPVNTFRADHDRAAVTQSSVLQNRAQTWASHLANLHVAIDDSGFDRTCWKLGGTIDGSNAAAGATTSKVIENFFQVSPDHRRNLLNRHYRWVGFGVASDVRYLYVVEDFCG